MQVEVRKSGRLVTIGKDSDFVGLFEDGYGQVWLSYFPGAGYILLSKSRTEPTTTINFCPNGAMRPEQGPFTEFVGELILRN